MVYGIFISPAAFVAGCVVVIIVGTYYAEGGPNYDGMGAGVVLAIVGTGMIWWQRRVSVRSNNAVQDGATQQAEIDREEAIQIQAEAILRAEQMRNSNNDELSLPCPALQSSDRFKKLQTERMAALGKVAR